MSQAYKELFKSKQEAAENLEEEILEDEQEYGIRNFDGNNYLSKIRISGTIIEVAQDENRWGYELEEIDGQNSRVEQ